MSPPRGISAAAGAELTQLLAQVGEGDQYAFSTLYERIAPILFGTCMRMLRNRELAEDVFQDAMLKIWSKAALFDPQRGAALPWLVALTRNTIFDRLSATRRDTFSLEEPQIASAVEQLDSFSDPEMGATVWQCVKKLKQAYKECLLLAYLYGMDYRELADRMAVPVGTIKTWVFRASNQVRSCIGS